MTKHYPRCKRTTYHKKVVAAWSNWVFIVCNKCGQTNGAT